MSCCSEQISSPRHHVFVPVNSKNFLPGESEHIFDFGSIWKVGQREKKRKGKKKKLPHKHVVDGLPLAWSDLWCCEFKKDMLCTSSSTEGDAHARSTVSIAQPLMELMATQRFWTWAAILPDCALGIFLRGSQKYWSKTTAWEKRQINIRLQFPQERQRECQDLRCITGKVVS